MIRTRAGCRIATCMLLLASVAAAALTDNEKTAIDQLTTMNAGQFQALRVQAGKGVPAAQTLLGIAYLKGIRVPKDDRAAFGFFQQAGKKKQTVALSNLGIMYFYGLGVEKNYVEAVKYFRQASADGNSNAQFNLATMYHHGFGVQQDLAEAAKWYEIAAVQGEPMAQNVLATFYESGTGVVKDPVQALKWYTKAAQNGYAIAQYNLGSLYREAEDHQTALEWFLRAAKQGHPGSIRNLVELYLHGHCMKVDYHQAYYWLASTHRQDDWATKMREECRKHIPERELQEMDVTASLEVGASR
jgi:uncharacterized protein